MRDDDGFVGSVALANMVPLARKDTVNMNSYMELLDTVAPTFRTSARGLCLYFFFLPFSFLFSLLTCPM